MQNGFHIVRLSVITHIAIPRANTAVKNYVVFVAVTWESDSESSELDWYEILLEAQFLRKKIGQILSKPTIMNILTVSMRFLCGTKESENIVDRVILGPKVCVGWSVGRLKMKKFLKLRHRPVPLVNLHLTVRCHILTDLWK